MKRKTIVVKIGSSTLTAGTNRISRGKIEDLARQIIELRDQYRFVIVSSGAIATAKQYIDLHSGNEIAVKQAMAAIGQPALMKIYQEGFHDFGLRTAQCLLHYYDMEREKSRQNIINTIGVLLDNDYIPIVNENDTVATQEIKFGDNDKLSALVAGVLKADLLILASDINGLYDDDPNKNPDAKIIPIVNDLEKVKHLGGESSTSLGTGGMQAKLLAAEICEKDKTEMWITNGNIPRFLTKVLSGEIECTKFQLG